MKIKYEGNVVSAEYCFVGLHTLLLSAWMMMVIKMMKMIGGGVVTTMVMVGLPYLLTSSLHLFSYLSFSLSLHIDFVCLRSVCRRKRLSWGMILPAWHFQELGCWTYPPSSVSCNAAGVWVEGGKYEAGKCVDGGVSVLETGVRI